MEIIDFISRLKHEKIDLSLAGSDLEVSFDGQEISETVIDEIKSRKVEIIDFLKKIFTAKDAPIPEVPVQLSYVLSPGQRRLWVLSQFEEGNTAYNMPVVCVFEGVLDESALEYAIITLIERHESLRTIFNEDKSGEVRQFILSPNEIDFSITHFDFRQDNDCHEKARQIVIADATKCFDLSKGPLLRASLCRVENNQWVFSCIMHHIVSDGWSMDILISELLTLYRARANGQANPLQPLRIQYKDYAYWLQEQLSGESLMEHKQYWLRQFEGEPPVLDLPADKPRPVIKTYNGGLVHKKINANLSKALKAFSQDEGGTVFMLLVTAVNAVLHKYTGQEDIILGTPIAGRDHIDLEDQIGFYLNTLALRTKFSKEDSFSQIFERVKKVTTGAYEHQVYPFDELVDELQLKRDTSRNALFDVMILLQAAGDESVKDQHFSDLKILRYDSDSRPVSKFDLTFTFVEAGEQISMVLDFNVDIYLQSTIEQLGNHFIQLLEAAMTQPSTPLEHLDFLSAEEKENVLVKFNDTELAFDTGKTVVELLQEQVRKTPGSTALVFEGTQLTYLQLNEQANRIANYLRNKYNVQPDELIGIQLPRSQWLLITMLGVMKAGGAYVPLDPAFPAERLEYIKTDSNCKLVIDEKVLNEIIQTPGLSVENPAISITSHNLAYCIYTSGSTGKPKGCLLTHRNLVNFFAGMNEVFGTEPGAFLSLTNFTFDISILELVWPLTLGYKVVLQHNVQNVMGDEAYSVHAQIANHRITHLQATPSMAVLLKRALADAPSLQKLLLGGERLPTDLANELYASMPGVEIYNMYGPTETTIWSACSRIARHADKILVGKPIANTQVYILDHNLQPLPPCIEGEIFIAGEGVAKSYLNKPELSNERFLQNPFITNGRMYRTGDYGRWLNNGTIEFIGRKDDQVKVRGYRIELGEIENALNAHPLIDAAVAVAHSNHEGEMDLVAYIVSHQPLEVANIRAHLEEKLPAYMVPALYIQLDAFPLTPSGKVDKKHLPNPNGMVVSSREYIAPRNATERKLVAIWQEVLGRERIGIKDNFFESGGHSLRATRLASRIYKEFGVKPGLKELFLKRTPEEQALLIASSQGRLFTEIPVTEMQPHYPLSSAQRRLWILSQFEESNIAYNIPGVYAMRGQIDPAALELAFQSVIGRHEILRTVFRQHETQGVRQYILSPEQSAFHLQHINARQESQSTVSAIIHNEVNKPFDLATGPMLRVSLLQLADENWILIYVMHHIISDAWSMEIIMKEVLYFYNADGKTLDPLRIQYKDYAVWQQEQLLGEELNVHKQYWLEQLAGELPVLDLPTDRPRPAMKTYKGKTINRRLPGELVKAIKELASQQDATLFMTLLAAVKLLLFRYSGQQDIIIGSPIAGRQHVDLEDQVGFYLNMLALRTHFNPQQDFRELLLQVKQVTLEAYEHQDYPFNQLVDDLQPGRDMSRSPLFDVFIDFHNARMTQEGGDVPQEISIDAWAGEQVISKFDLTFLFAENNDGVNLTLEYNTDLYDEQTIERMYVHFEQLAKLVTERPLQPAGKLEYLNEEETNRLLHVFNPSKQNIQQPSIPVLFEEQVRKTPDRCAVMFNNAILSYKELHEQSSRLGNYLQQQYGIGVGDKVGIMLDRSEKMIISIMGILMSGAAYVPIDAAYPTERKEYIMQDSGIKMLITQTEYIFDIGYYHGNILAIDVQLGSMTEPMSSAVEHLHDHAAYVIYTSGSTGNPKGCVITQGNLSHYINWANDYYFGDKIEPVMGLYTSLSFDLTVTSIFCTLTTGGKLVVYDQQQELLPILRHNFSKASNINSIKLTPSHINMLKLLNVEHSPIELAIVGGEQLTEDQVRTLKAINPAMKIYNEYGPTETTVGCIVKEVEPNTRVLIGKPITNTSVYILDAQGVLCPIGIKGEICIAGSGVGQGYINKPELTAQKFVPDPFNPGERMYKTGDWGRWLSNSELEFTGRKDDQVKIRGYRIELGEIENALQNYEGIDAVAIMVKTNKQGEKELAAYLAAKETLSISALRAFLGNLLPAYMVPAHFVQLDTMPLTQNGKIDRKQLPALEGFDISSTSYTAPRTPLEEKLVAIWKLVLEKEKIGVTDSFFDLGGDSIKILRVISEIKKELGLEIPLALIYQNNTIENVAAEIILGGAGIKEQNKLLRNQEAQVNTELAELRERIVATLTAQVREKIEDVYPMSAIEKGMLFGSMLEDGFGVYHDQFLFRQHFADFDIARFTNAMRLLVAKHSILRAGFNLTDYETEVKFVYRYVDVRIDHKDVSAAEPAEQEKIMWDYMRADLQNPFDIAMAPLWRMSVFSLGKNEWTFLWQFHHAILDGWSTASFITELNNLYISLGEDNAYQPANLASNYKDFIVRHIIDQQNEEARTFWRNELSGYSRLDLFTPKEHYEGHAFLLEQAMFRKLEERATQLNTTVRVISLSAYLYMLKILNYGNDILIGVVTNTRPNIEDSDKVLGCFLNSIPLRMEINSNEQCAELVKRVNQKIIELKDKERMSLAEIAHLHNEQQETGNPFFDVLFNYIDFHAFNVLQRDDKIVQEESTTVDGPAMIGGRERTNTYFDCSISTTGGGYVFSLRLTKKLKSGLSAVKIRELFMAILQYMVQDTTRALKDFDWLGEAERKTLLVDFNKRSVAFPAKKTLAALFEDQAKATPHNVALVFGEIKLTYEQLNESVNQLAHYLRDNYAVHADDLIGVQLERSQWMIIAILGVLKAGGAYVPIDPTYPGERIDYIVDDCKCKVVIDANELEKFIARQQRYSTSDPAPASTASNLAYVIYTSGSTGWPKGVMIEQRSVVSLITFQRQEFGFTAQDNVLQSATISFDASVEQIFLALTTGACLTLISKDVLLDPVELETFIDDHNITHLHAVPAILKTVPVKKYNSIVRVLCGGERCPVELADKWNTYCTFYNKYGPTETTVTCIEFNYSSGYKDLNAVPIGHPLGNTHVYILNEDKLVPIGVPGEIYIGGEGVARGYLNKPELTAEKFVQNPFSPGERMYKTGDLGRWLPDGLIDFIGRKDNQVKLRGYRIELGEIENALHTYPGIEAAVVVVKSINGGEPELVAYVTGNQELQAHDIRTWLEEKLPDYMVPGLYVQLDALPLTPSGKIDRKKLPEPNLSAITGGREYVPPRNATEAKLVAIWEEVLGRTNIGIKDNFFESGGHSLLVTRLAGRIYKEFDVKPALRDLFIKRTVQEQATLIAAAGRSIFEGIPVAQPQEYYPLSSAQRRLWIMSQLEESNIAYNISGAYSLSNVDPAALEYAFRSVIERHEILRTIFKADEQGRVHQYIQPANEFNFRLHYNDLGDGNSQQAFTQLVGGEMSQPFDLSTGPLLRVSLYKLTADSYVVVYVMHHIISDAWSIEIMMKEVLSYYEARINGNEYSPASLSIQYKDYAAWQQEQLHGEAFKQHKDYWLKQFEGELPVLDLPADRPRPAVKTYNGNAIKKRLSGTVSNGLRQIGQDHGATLFMGLLSAVNALFYRYTGQTDIITGSPIAERPHIDLENQLGFYVNSLALRTHIGTGDSFSQLLGHVKQMTLEAYEHQAYPFDELVDALQLRRDMSRNALFDVMMTLQTGGLREAGGTFTKFDLIFQFAESGEEIHALIEYNTDLYNKSTAERMADHLEQLMAAMVHQPGAPIETLDYLSETEKQQILIEFSDASVEYPHDKTITELFDEQVKLTPANTALVFEDIEFTYTELNDAANRLSAFLSVNYNIQPEDRIGIMLDRSDKLIIAILAVLKSGAAYVPVDPEFPAARREFILHDTAAKVLITQAAYKDQLENYTGSVVDINDLPAATVTNGAPSPKTHPGSMAYIMFTSGSTGTPKGVMVEHRAVVRLVKSANYVPLTENETILSTGAISFDATTFEYWGMLLNGGKLVMCGKDVLLDELKLAEVVQSQKVSIMFFTTGWFNQLVSNWPQVFAGLRSALTGGEKLSRSHVNALQAAYPALDIIHVYGPTENTTFSLYCLIEPGMITVPVGKPISNSTAYILDNRQQLVPIGVMGEILVGGHGVARGYLGNSELTAQKFIANPFRESDRLYRTGDLGRWMPDGNIEFIGRIDNQLKIRGFRVELGEIENTLQTYPGVEASIVVVRAGENAEKELVAYIKTSETLDAIAVRSFLAKLLPAYMVPSYYVQVDEFPLMSTGKVDKKKLPAPHTEGALALAEYTAPRNETERKLVAVFELVLKKSPVSIRDDFFMIGGDSFKVMHVVSALRKSGYIVTAKQVMQFPVIEELALHIEEGAQQAQIIHIDSTFIEPAWHQLRFIPEEGGVPGIILNVTQYAELDTEIFAKAARIIIQRHESLRTVFEFSNGKTMQHILPLEALNFQPAGVAIVNAEEMNNIIVKAKYKRFDLYKAPLLSMEIYKVENGNYCVIITIDHALADGYSVGILKKEFEQLYAAMAAQQAPSLEPLPFQYKDFVSWQKQFLASPDGQKHLEYWFNRLRGFDPLINIIPPPDEYDPTGVVITDKIEGQLYHDAEQFAKQNGLTLNALVLGTLTLTLARLLGKNDITVIVSDSARHSEYMDVDTENIIGFFVNQLMVRTIVDNEKPLLEQAHSMQGDFIEDLSFKAYPFMKLIRELLGARNISSFDGKLFFYNYQNFEFFKEMEWQVSQEESAWDAEQGSIGSVLEVIGFKNCLQLKFKLNYVFSGNIIRGQVSAMYFSIFREIIYGKM